MSEPINDRGIHAMIATKRSVCLVLRGGLLAVTCCGIKFDGHVLFDAIYYAPLEAATCLTCVAEVVADKLKRDGT